MAPKKKVERGAQENISLGPQVREGEHYEGCSRAIGTRAAGCDLLDVQMILTITFLQASLFSALPVSSPHSTTPSFTSPISRMSPNESISAPRAHLS
jgi:hypothetical protein